MGNLRNTVIPLNGKRFGHLTVSDKPYVTRPRDGRDVYFWECTCDCGTVLWVSGRRLREHRTTQCGCGIGRDRTVRCLDHIDEYINGGYESVSIVPTIEGFIRWLNVNGNVISHKAVRTAIRTHDLEHRFISGNTPGARTWTVDRFRMWRKRPAVLDHAVLGVDDDGLPSYDPETDRNLFEFMEDQLMFRWATETDRWKMLGMARELFDARRAVVRERGLLKGEIDGCVDDGRFATV